MKNTTQDKMFLLMLGTISLGLSISAIISAFLVAKTTDPLFQFIAGGGVVFFVISMFLFNSLYKLNKE